MKRPRRALVANDTSAPTCEPVATEAQPIEDAKRRELVDRLADILLADLAAHRPRE